MGRKDNDYGEDGVDEGGCEVEKDTQHDHKEEEGHGRSVDGLVHRFLKRTFDGTPEEDTRKKSKLGGKLAHYLRLYPLPNLLLDSKAPAPC